MEGGRGEGSGSLAEPFKQGRGVGHCQWGWASEKGIAHIQLYAMTAAEGGLSLELRAATDACARGVSRGLEAVAARKAADYGSTIDIVRGKYF